MAVAWMDGGGAGGFWGHNLNCSPLVPALHFTGYYSIHQSTVCKGSEHTAHGAGRSHLKRCGRRALCTLATQGHIAAAGGTEDGARLPPPRDPTRAARTAELGTQGVFPKDEDAARGRRPRPCSRPASPKGRPSPETKVKLNRSHFAAPPEGASCPAAPTPPSEPKPGAGSPRPPRGRAGRTWGGSRGPDMPPGLHGPETGKRPPPRSVLWPGCVAVSVVPGPSAARGGARRRGCAGRHPRLRSEA